LRSVEHPTADIGKSDTAHSYSSSQRRGVYLVLNKMAVAKSALHSRHLICDPSWKLKKFHNTATHTTLADQILISSSPS